MREGGEPKLRTAETNDLFKLLPHRYPFLLVDRIIDMDGDRSATGIKNVSVNEPYFQGHFPRSPIMPGMLLIEGLAQTAGALCMRNLEVKEPPLVYFITIDKARFRRPVVPGDILHYYVQRSRSTACLMCRSALAHTRDFAVRARFKPHSLDQNR
jgi:3-hydroxyacyl-[acyl-carrier-protein] dehydratase